MKKRIINWGLIFSVVTTLIAGLALGCYFSNFKINKISDEKVYAVEPVVNLGGKDYSALWDGDVIFSVDKVGVALTPSCADNGLYYTTNQELGNAFYGVKDNSNIPFYFDDSQREVVANGGFVKLNNSKQGGNLVSNSIIYNEQTISVQEAVMVSFGQYIYNAESDLVTKVTETTSANISYAGFEVTATRNGETISDNFLKRSITTDGVNYYGDFVYLIPEAAGTEGFYQFDVKYMIYGVTYTNHFEFYLVFQSSYNDVVKAEHNENLTYTTNPTLGWYNQGTTYAFETKDANNNEFFPYKVGVDGISTAEQTKSAVSYPTITYDYTRYKMSYTFKTATKTIDYDYTFAFDSVTTNLGGDYVNAPLVVTDSLGNSTSHNMFNYHGTSGKNIVSVMFTESGQYTFTFEYLYIGAAGTEIQTINEFPTIEYRFEIFGGELKYSRGNQDAKMSYYQIANNSDISDLIINGGKMNSTNFGYDYIFDTESDLSNNLKVGTILPNKNVDINGNEEVDDFLTQDGLINAQIIGNDSVFNFTTGELNKDNIAKEKYFVKTNQSSAWIISNNAFTDSSVYYYSSTLSGLKSAESKQYNSMVPFNETGYYVICLQIDTKIGPVSNTEKFYQIFCFKYSTITIDIKVETDENPSKSIGAGKFTDKNVVVSWAEPDVFEWKVKGYYYELIDTPTIQASNYSRDEIISSQTAHEITNHQTVIGTNVVNTYAKYVIELKRIGSSATYMMFTIDRSPITGVQSYVVDTRRVGSSTQYYYYLKNGSYLPISNCITDSYATLDWDNKESGSEVTASYTYLELVKDDSKVVNNVTISGLNATITKYKIGGITGPLNLQKQTSRDNLSYSSVLFNQGVYFFTLTDTAGNSINYILLIDKTETFVQITNNSVSDYHSQDYSMFTNDVSYSVSSYKAIDLSVSGESYNKYLTTIDKIITGDTATKNSYVAGNVSVLQNLFYSSEGQRYIFVKNLSCVEYVKNSETNPYTNLGRLFGTVEGNDNESVQKVIYVTSSNNSFSSVVKNLNNPSEVKSYVTIRVNKDQSQGMVYYSEVKNATIDSIPTDGSDNGSLYNLTTTSSISGISATSAKFVLFTWRLGTDTVDYKVKDVYYSVYSLQQNNFIDTSRYFYQTSADKIYLYNDYSQEAGTVISGDRAFAYLTKGQNSQEGLYVVTRVYQNGNSQNYWFIVDRQGIISGEVGGNIKINLLENETSFNDFKIGYTSTQTYSSVFGGEPKANIYLTTDKLPATISVPLGKYFNGSNYSNYYAGKLNVNLYFVDTEKQISSYFENKPITFTLFENKKIENTGSNNYFNFNLIDYFSSINNLGNNYQTYGIVSSNNGNWICLPGVYVLEIYDNVESQEGSHSVTIGFKVESQNGPSIEIKTISNAEIETVYQNTNNYYISTNDDVVSFVLPSYVENETKLAQVDNEYLIVEKYVDDVLQSPKWIDYKRGDSNNQTVKLSQNGNFVTIAGDSKTITLDTNAPLNQKLYYRITIRYKLWNKQSDSIEKYLNCYFRYSEFNKEVGGKVYYYESVITVEIDRIAPMDNVNDLYKIDNFINNIAINNYTDIKTNSSNSKNPIFKNSSFNDGGNTIYSYVYDAYYVNNDRTKIYAFLVNQNTTFKSDDVAVLRYKPVVKNSISLSTNIQPYNYSTIQTPQYNTFEFLGADGLYEILEYDNAGNMTQYLVHYSNSNENIQIPVSVEGYEQTKTVVLGKDVDDVAMFKMSVGSSSTADDYFYRIELNRNSSTVKTFSTNLTTEFESTELASSIIKMISGENGAGYGDYDLVIKSRKNINNPYSVRINYYSNKDISNLDIADLVVETNNQKRIVLDNANKTIGNNFIYAKEIELTFNGVKTTYVCDASNGEYNYYNKANKQLVTNNTIVCDSKTDVYLIVMTDILDRKQTYISGDNFEYVKFVNGTVEKGYSKIDGVYYGFNDVELHFSNSVFNNSVIRSFSINEQIIDSANYSKYIITENVGTENIIKVNRIENSIINFIVDLTYIENNEKLTYNIVVDAKMPTVSLKDKSGIAKDMIERFDAGLGDRFDIQSTSFGNLTLSWSEDEEQTYYNLKYYLYELGKDGLPLSTLDLTNDISTFVTSSGSGISSFRFVVEVWTNEENSTLIGNKIFAFNVKSQSGQLYYIQDEHLEIQNSYADFSLKELNNNSLVPSGVDSTDLSLETKFPLYITYQSNPFTISLVDSQTASNMQSYELNKDNYVFKLFKITTQTSNVVYVGILTLLDGESQSAMPFSRIQINDKVINDQIADCVIGTTDGVVVSGKLFKPTDDYFDYLTKKNLAVVDVYYGDSNTIIHTYQFDYSANGFEFEVLGTGRYLFEFRDLANRHQIFAEYTDQLNVVVLQEVAVSINDENVIENAIYNSNVVLKVLQTQRYIIGSLNVTATRNGQPYSLSGGSPYTFSEYGTYRVTITAKYRENAETEEKDYVDLKKVVEFTILNSKEAFEAFDLTSIADYELVKVLNPTGTDKTVEFKNLLDRNLSTKGMLINYSDLILDAENLSLSSGKVTLNLTYRVNDGIYPTREFSFDVTLNNEKPTIECSLGYGEKTNKGFEIYFNPGIIFDKVGEAYIYINDRLVATITEGSSYTNQSVATTFKEFGAGDYYITLKSASGVIYTSYVVTITEPLNTWAIILIVVAVALVITVTVVIIVLRTKMKIR